ncbi:MAG: glucose 1-dehydrogenase [Ignavibacteriaceae bacterium]|jgi:NAD(P)-dependent dehydrogenase (short-subunit alcohol dehydrogenase family)
MQKRFEGKVVIVTGGGKGIGQTSAIAFAQEGGQVAIADIDEEAGNATVRQIKEMGGKAIFLKCNVSKSSDVQQLVKETVLAFGGVDVLYNNAGVVRYGTVVEMSEEDWDYQININLKASFLTCKYAIPEMIKRGGGVIVNTASAQAFASQKTVAAYAASKGGIVSFTTTVALDHAGDNIRCNCIAPGSIQTPMLDEAAELFGPKDNPAQAITDWGKMHPIGRVGRSEEVAKMVLFLASEDASFCTGGCYRIEGGLLSTLL